ncbi:unnamed protein product [Commensalibacter communis]|uniref:hypothetical protein n=1 Tax=Commensalibacter communis TaxID=2972786 RepID=UPI0022FF7752|nr:hypothetical protein [Commensalibacter communis]CAI3929311.1 unnamed protein product [Commensalibacter communis]CAI3929938.1 unnamed protein product [Commensalibacter communis]
MKTLFLSCSFVTSFFVTYQTYGQNVQNTALYPSAVNNLQQSMPRKATIDGKRIYSVNSDHICSITVTMESSRKYQFSLLTWPENSRVDEAGYTEFILSDTNNKPHILRTDKVKGVKFLNSMRNLIKNCQDFSKNKKISES